MSNPSSRPSNQYIGRFAPSPTGPLHLGSLVAAIASYIDARANAGTWLVRMEDLDPPREPPGAADQILLQLEQFGLEWDGSVLYQSSRLDAYRQVLQQLRDEGLCYACSCTRPRIRAMGSIYNGHCRDLLLEDSGKCSIRIKTEPLEIAIADAVQGNYDAEIASTCGDFIIRRKDGLFAYQLAVVVDDQFQKITQVIRGSDLLDSTPRQIYLQQVLQYKTPAYGHIPVIVDEKDQKLSKQRFAAPIDWSRALELTHQVLHLLGQAPPPLEAFRNSAELLSWAVCHWDIQAVPKLATIAQAKSR